MITFLVEDYNTFSNKTYIDLIDSISLNQLTCPGKHGNPCGHKGCMIKHGSYARTFSHDGLSETIFIVRVICKECGTTHALIPSNILPYSQFPVMDITNLISLYEDNSPLDPVMENNPYIDRSVAFSYVRKYLLYWKERIKSIPLHLSTSSGFIWDCFYHFGIQFMQIKRTSNILFCPPT